MTTDVQVSNHLFRVEITATTDITVPPAHVWRVLTDTASYPQWNPFVRRLDGELAVGRRITVDLQPGRRPPQTLHPRIVDFSAGRGFTWLGRVGFPGVLDGRHRFTVEPSAGGGTRLVQHEILSGALVPVFRAMLTRDTPAAFAALNDALAVRAEHPTGTAPATARRRL